MSRSIAAVSSCWPNASARRRASRASASPSSAPAGLHVCHGQAVPVTRRLCILRLAQLLELGDGVVEAPRGQQHSPEVVAREAELRVRGHGLTILVQRLVQFSLALEQLAQVVARLRVQRIGRHCQAIGRRGLAPPLLQAEQHAVVVVRLVHVVAEGEHGLVVRFGLRPLPRTAVERDQIGVGLRERRIACERRLVRLDGAREIAGLGQTQAASQVRTRIVADRRHACGERIVDRRPSCAVKRDAARARHALRHGDRARAATAQDRSRPRQTAGRARWHARNA